MSQGGTNPSLPHIPTGAWLPTSSQVACPRLSLEFPSTTLRNDFGCELKIIPPVTGVLLAELRNRGPVVSLDEFIKTFLEAI